ncbi:hypothetical protein [Pseudoclavibacter helvolus]|uniref:hypothetical protein n=1 Tax=Pseudoclavibacter helvolus TaxID=255205 RepID=UPI003735BBE7
MSNLYPPASPSDEPFESRSDAEAGPLSDEARLRAPNPTPLFDSVAPGTPPPALTSTTPSDGSSSRTDAAKQQASEVKDTVKAEAQNVAGTAKAEAKNVAGTAKAEAKNVAGEAKVQAKDLYRQTTRQLTEQASQQQERAASGLKSLSGEFHDMVEKSEAHGIAGELVRRSAELTGAVGDWLEARGPGEVVNEVKSFARRKPGTFIAIAAITGLVAGRLTRSLAEAAKDDHEDGSTAAATPQESRTRATFTAADTYDTADSGTTSIGDGGYGAVGTGTQAGPQIGTPPQHGSTPPPVTEPNTYAFGDDTPAYTTDDTPLHRAADDDTLPPRGAGL